MSKGFLAAAILNIIGVCGGAYLAFTALREPLVEPPPQDIKEMTVQQYLHHQNIFTDKPMLYTFDPLTVNLANIDEDRVLQLELNLELMDEKSYEEVVSKSASVRDAVVKILANKKFEDINTVQGKLYLKDDISLAINEQLSQGLIKGVYFTTFFMQ
ncbi:MAG: flagellar basal body-associated FliL family protein [Bdellovibrionaceae bacterium]|nr:flagellar basal body-associated FliL family protein [Pseudobdellovibrionaceae bacterium]